MTKNINMDNRLAAIWRENVNALLKRYNLSKTDLGRMIGRSASTIQGNFGSAELTRKSSPSIKTIEAIERQFKLHAGSLSKEDFNPNSAPAESPKLQAAAQLATLTIPIPDDKLARIMRILNE